MSISFSLPQDILNLPELVRNRHKQFCSVSVTVGCDWEKPLGNFIRYRAFQPILACFGSSRSSKHFMRSHKLCSPVVQKGSAHARLTFNKARFEDKKASHEGKVRPVQIWNARGARVCFFAARSPLSGGFPDKNFRTVSLRRTNSRFISWTGNQQAVGNDL